MTGWPSAAPFKKGNCHCEITECVRAEEALECVRSDDLSFNLLVVDHGLPGISGLELCKELLDARTPLPLVLLTGAGSQQLAVEALKAGVYDYIIKDPGQGLSRSVARGAPRRGAEAW